MSPVVGIIGSAELALVAAAVVTWGWVIYLRWVSGGEVIRIQVVDKYRRKQTDGSIWKLDVVIGDLFGGDLDTVKRRRVNKGVWMRTEIDDYVSANYRSVSLAGRTINTFAVEGGSRSDALLYASMSSIGALVASYMYFTG